MVRSFPIVSEYINPFHLSREDEVVGFSQGGEGIIESLVGVECSAAGDGGKRSVGGGFNDDGSSGSLADYAREGSQYYVVDVKVGKIFWIEVEIFK